MSSHCGVQARSLRCLLALCLLTLCCASFLGVAQADPAPPAPVSVLPPGLPGVSVSGPAGCPNAAQLAEEVNRADGRERLQVSPTGAHYSVEFSRWDAGFDALIRDRSGRVRSLAGDSGDCMELGRAVALTLLVLLDQPAPSARDYPAPGPAPPSSRGATSGKSHGEISRGWRAVAGMQLGVGTLLPEAAPLISGYLGLREPLDAEVWLAASTDVRVEHGPGGVEIDWFGVGARGCFVVLKPLSACGGALLSRLRAAGSGYDDFNQRVVRWQPALDAGLKLQAAWREVLEGRISLQGELPLARERFTVSGVQGAAFETPVVGVLLFAGLGARF